MKIDFKEKIKHLYKSSWFITIFATTLGVLLAFYLNNLSSRSKIEHRKQVSIENINKELLNNKSELMDSKINDQLIFFLNKINDIDSEISNVLSTSVSSMNYIKKTYPDYMEIVDSTIIDRSINTYNVKYRFELNLKDLQNIAWEAAKMSNILNEIDYDCLQQLVRIYSLQDIFNQEQQKILKTKAIPKIYIATMC